MKILKQISALLFSLLIFSSFITDKRLTQEDAAATIHWFKIEHFNNEDLAWKVILWDVIQTDPVRQSSSKDAYCMATFRAKVATGDPKKQCEYTETVLTIDFHFENFIKNKEHKWILTGINTCTSEVKVNEDHLAKFIQKNKVLNMFVSD